MSALPASMDVVLILTPMSLSAVSLALQSRKENLVSLPGAASIRRLRVALLKAAPRTHIQI